MSSQHPTPSSLRRRLPATALSLAALCLAAGARADSIQLRLGTFDDVAVTGVADGKVQFQNTSTSKRGDCPIAQVQVLKIDAVPALQQAMELVQKKDDRAAIRKFGDALVAAKRLPKSHKQKVWLVPFIQFEMAASHARLKEGLPAAMLYCELLQETAEGTYYEELPAAQIKDLDEVARKSLFEHIKAIRAKVPADNQALLDRLRDATGITEEAPPPVAPGPGATSSPSVPPSGVKPAVNVQAGALVLPQTALRFIRENGTEVPDLKQALAGQYSAAVKAMEKALEEHSDNTPLRLFVLGRVRQELAKVEADAAQKTVQLQEATLDFARVAAQFRDNAVYPASLLELAVIQRDLGHEITAQKIFKDIPPAYGDDKSDAVYADRYNAFKAADPGDGPAKAAP